MGGGEVWHGLTSPCFGRIARTAGAVVRGIAPFRTNMRGYTAWRSAKPLHHGTRLGAKAIRARRPKHGLVSPCHEAVRPRHEAGMGES